MTTEELVCLARNNDELALKEIINMYNQILKINVSKYLRAASKCGLEYSDLYQESLVGLIEAIKLFDETKNKKFSTIITLIVNRKLQDLIKNNNRKKNNVLNEAISLDNDSLGFYNILSTSGNIIDKVINSETDKEIKEYLTIEEIKVYELKKQGRSNSDISKILDKPYKNITNTISRIKCKLISLD